MKPPIARSVAVLAALTVTASRAAAPDLSLELLERNLSHLAPHVLTDLLPPGEPAVESPAPSELLAPLGDGDGDIVKGMEPDSEGVLARALLSASLRQRLLKVAVATVSDKRMGLIKLQAGDQRTGFFRIRDLEDDAVSALKIAFRLPIVPSIKITGDPTLKPESAFFDYYAGAVIEGTQTKTEASEEFMRVFLDIVSGKPTTQEYSTYREVLDMFASGPVM